MTDNTCGVLEDKGAFEGVISPSPQMYPSLAAGTAAPPLPRPVSSASPRQPTEPPAAFALQFSRPPPEPTALCLPQHWGWGQQRRPIRVATPTPPATPARCRRRVEASPFNRAKVGAPGLSRPSWRLEHLYCCWARCSHASLDLLQEWEPRREKGVRRESCRAPHPCSFTPTATSRGSQVTPIVAVGEPTTGSVQPSLLRQRAGVYSGTAGGGRERGERGRGGERGGGLVRVAGAKLARSLLLLTAWAAAQRRRIGRKCGNVWQPASLVQVCSRKMDRNAPLGEHLAFFESVGASSLHVPCACAGQMHGSEKVQLGQAPWETTLRSY
nr:PREDICTED: uncharacterized protein LOC106700836 [Bos mutus]